MKKKIVTAFMAFTMIFYFVDSASASSKSQTVINAFQNYLDEVNNTYQVDILAAQNTYEPQIRTSKDKLISAQTQFLNVNQVTILKTTSYSSNPVVSIDAVNCPATHSDCKSIMKSNEFTAGEIANIYNFVGGVEAFTNSSFIQMNNGLLQTIDDQVKNGLIKLNDPSGYNAVVGTIRSETTNLDSLIKQYDNLKTSLTLKRDVGLEVEPALLAAERATKNSSNFDKAFVVAFKFEYNRIKLNQLASAPWTYINSYKALSSAISITRLSDQADAVGDNYSYSRALSINNACSSAFISSTTFKDNFNLVAKIYKKATKITLKL